MTIYPRKKEMRARYLLATPSSAAWRVKRSPAGLFLQLKDRAAGQFRPVWTDAGVLQAGALEP